MTEYLTSSLGWSGLGLILGWGLAKFEQQKWRHK